MEKELTKQYSGENSKLFWEKINEIKGHKNMNQKQRSKHWNELVEILEKEFPKKKCRKRGQALVLLSFAEMFLQKEEKALAEKIKEIEGLKKTMMNPLDFDVNWRNRIKTTPLGFKKLGFNKAIDQVISILKK